MSQEPGVEVVPSVNGLRDVVIATDNRGELGIGISEHRNQLGKEKHLTGLEPAAFSDRAAHYLGELNALHPFREGNGREQREFISHLAHNSGYYIAWENVNRADMLQASVESFKGDTPKLPR